MSLSSIMIKIQFAIDSAFASSLSKVFVCLNSADKARALVEKDIARLEAEKVNLDKELEANAKKIKKLKSTLYGKFGNSINLDE